MMKTKLLLLISSLLLVSACSAKQEGEFKEQLREALKESPDILYQVIRENPAEFMAVLQSAARQAEQQAALAQRQREKEEFEAAFSNPLKPQIRDDEAIRGTQNAPLVLVEYSDFQCPFCQRGATTVKQLMKRYDGKIQFIYKHLPLDFHAAAMPAARYYEALRMQDAKLAFKFHDEIFKDSNKLKQGEAFLTQVAKSTGADMGLLRSTLKDRSDEINARIREDIAESRKFGMTGTPGFILNGIPLRGAFPVQQFEQVISELKKRGLVDL